MNARKISNNCVYCTPKIFAAIWLDDTYPIIQILDSNDLTSYRSKRRNGFVDKILKMIYLNENIRYIEGYIRHLKSQIRYLSI